MMKFMIVPDVPQQRSDLSERKSGRGTGIFQNKIPCADFGKKKVMSTKKAKQNDHLLRIKLKGVGGCFDSVPGEFKLICVCGF